MPAGKFHPAHPARGPPGIFQMAYHDIITIRQWERYELPREGLQESIGQVKDFLFGRQVDSSPGGPGDLSARLSPGGPCARWSPDELFARCMDAARQIVFAPGGPELARWSPRQVGARWVSRQMADGAR